MSELFNAIGKLFKICSDIDVRYRESWDDLPENFILPCLKRLLFVIVHMFVPYLQIKYGCI
jgi:hypothetical protein